MSYCSSLQASQAVLWKGCVGLSTTLHLLMLFSIFLYIFFFWSTSSVLLVSRISGHFHLFLYFFPAPSRHPHFPSFAMCSTFSVPSLALSFLPFFSYLPFLPNTPCLIFITIPQFLHFCLPPLALLIVKEWVVKIPGSLLCSVNIYWHGKHPH